LRRAAPDDAVAYERNESRREIVAHAVKDGELIRRGGVGGGVGYSERYIRYWQAVVYCDSHIANIKHHRNGRIVRSRCHLRVGYGARGLQPVQQRRERVFSAV
jgi:hypothetical protein